MLLKLGVDISRLKRPIRRKLKTIDNIFLRYGDEGIITSTYEGSHSPSSLHYSDEAIDLGIPKVLVKVELTLLIKDLKTTLGNDFDVVLEIDHIHVEYDIG